MLIILAVVAIVSAILLIRAGRRLLGGLIGLFGAVVLVAAIVLVLFADAYKTPTESMLPTIRVDERVLAVDLGDPEVGEIVVIEAPAAAATSGRCVVRPPKGAMCARPDRGQAGFKLIKRVVAKGGDRIAMRDGRVIRNGRPAEEPYAKRCKPDCRFPTEITVPAGTVFVLGDNRGASDDSRFWGPVPTASVRGRVVARYWPLSRAGSL